MKTISLPIPPARARRRIIRWSALAAAAGMAAGPAARHAGADNFTLTNNDGSGQSSFTNPLTGGATGWTDTTTPSTGNAPTSNGSNLYEVKATTTGNYLLLTPTGTAAVTFGGDTLQLDTQAELVLSGTGTITVNNLALNGGNIDLSSVAATDTLAGAIALGDGTTSSIFADTGSTLTVSAVISGGTGNIVFGANNLKVGNGAATLNAAGTVVLSGANTWAGTATVAAGILKPANLTALPTSTGNITVNAGATFDTSGLDFGNANPQSFAIGGAGASSTPGAIINSSTSAEGSISGLTLNGNATIGTNASKLNIYGTAINLNGNTLTINGTGQTDIRTDDAIQPGGSIVVNVSGAGGLLRLESSQTMFTGTYTINSGATIDSWGAGRTEVGNVVLNGGTLTNGNGDSTWTGTVALSAPSTIGDGGNLTTIKGVVSGGGDLTKTGSGITTFSAANTFTGNITVNGGVLLANTNTGGSNLNGNFGNVSVARTITVNAGDVLSMTTNDVLGRGQAATPINASIVLNGGTLSSSRYNAIGNITLNNGGNLTQNATDTGSFFGYQFVGTVTADGTSATTITNGSTNAGDHLLNNTTFNVLGTGGALIVTAPLINPSGNFSGTGALTKAGPGVLALGGKSTYSGGTTISAGTVAVFQGSTGAGNTPLGTGAVTLAGGTLSVRDQNQIALAGWNADVIHGNGENTTNGDFGTNAAVDGGTFIFYENGSQGAPQKGLPTGGVLVNANNGIVYQLQPYTAMNDLRLTPGSATATLTLANPGKFTALHIADVGGSGNAGFSFTLNFSDGSSTVVNNQTAPDWFNNTPFVDSNFGRLDASNGAYNNVSGNPGNPRIYEDAFTLAPADAAKTLMSIDFNDPGNAATSPVLNVFAVTGEVSSASYTNSLAVTSNSTIDTQNVTSVTLGPLAIGANTLSVTGTSGATVTLGATSLTGNAGFAPATGITLALGAVTQDASPRGLTMSGAGKLLLSAANTYTGTTTISSGTLALSTTTANNIAGSKAIAVGGGAKFDVTGVTAAGGFVLASGQALGGSGTVAGPLTVGTGSTISAGTSTALGTGASNTTGNLTTAGQTWSTGGTYAWKLNLANAGTGGTSAASPNTDKTGANWDQLSMNALAVNASAGGFTINISSIGAASGGGSFNPGLTYAWVVANVPAASGPTNLAAANAALAVNSGSFTPSGGVFSALFEAPSNDPGNTDLVVTFTPAPEPTSVMLFGIGAGALLMRRRRAARG